MGRDGSIVFLMKVMNIFCKKHIKMENKEQDFINRYKNVQESNGMVAVSTMRPPASGLEVR